MFFFTLAFWAGLAQNLGSDFSARQRLFRQYGERFVIMFTEILLFQNYPFRKMTIIYLTVTARGAKPGLVAQPSPVQRRDPRY